MGTRPVAVRIVVVPSVARNASTRNPSLSPLAVIVTAAMRPPPRSIATSPVAVNVIGPRSHAPAIASEFTCHAGPGSGISSSNHADNTLCIAISTRPASPHVTAPRASPSPANCSASICRAGLHRMVAGAVSFKCAVSPCAKVSALKRASARVAAPAAEIFVLPAVASAMKFSMMSLRPRHVIARASGFNPRHLTPSARALPSCAKLASGPLACTSIAIASNSGSVGSQRASVARRIRPANLASIISFARRSQPPCHAIVSPSVIVMVPAVISARGQAKRPSALAALNATSPTATSRASRLKSTNGACATPDTRRASPLTAPFAANHGCFSSFTCTVKRAALF